MACRAENGAQPGGCAHLALLYASDDELVSVAVPFVAEGLEAGEPVLVVLSPEKCALVREALGADAERVVFEDSFLWYQTPVETLASYRHWVQSRLQGGAGAARIVGEAIWPVGSPSAVREWKRYESVFNVEVEHTPVRALCLYDRRLLPAEILASAEWTHPEVWRDGAFRASDLYTEPDEYFRLLDRA